MKLTDIFAGRTKNEDIGRLQTTAPPSSNTAAVNRQIRSLVPGQTIQGEIVSRNGGEVQIRTPDDLVFNARVDQNMNIEVGKNMTFEVKNNGSALTLSPLFTNVSTDINVLKALDMAGISANETSVAMTEQMMKAGLPVDRNAIQLLYREVNAYPDAEISDIVNLHKLGLPVNRETVNQMAAYRNLNYQLLQGMETVMDALPNVIEELTAKGDMAGAARLYQELLHMAGENGMAEALPSGEAAGETAGNVAEGNGGVTQGTMLQNPGVQDPDTQNPAAQGINGQGALEGSKALEMAVKLSTDPNEIETTEPLPFGEAGGALKEGQEQEIPKELRAAVARELGQVLSHLELTPRESAQLAQQIRQFAEGSSDVGKLFQGLQQMLGRADGENPGGKEALQLLLSGKGLRTLLADTIKNAWTVRPQEVADPHRVEDLYQRLNRQVKGLTQVLETVGQGGSEACKAASNLSQNIDFLQQVNQMYTYVQLPLRMQQGNAHGDLYVYTNKRNLAGKDGTVSALLHLDMDHLGPVDVYVAMQNSKVSTRFFVADDEMLDFLGAHMDLLTDRLRKRGYDCSMSMEIRGEKASGSTKGGLGPLLEQEKGVALSHYAFDVRT